MRLLGDNRMINVTDKEMTMEEINAKHSELQEAAKPLLEILNRDYDPMCTAIVTEGFVRIVRSEIGATLPIRD